MATTNVIRLSQLEGAKRIDAEFYQPIFDALKVIEKIETKKLGSICQISYGTTPAGAEFYSEGIPFIRSQDFSFLIIDEKNIVFCSREFHTRNKKSEIKPRDLLFAAVGGTIGQVGIVQDWLRKGNINQNIARARFINKKFLPEFGVFFFLSKYGQLQIFRLVTGNAQPYLNSYQIKSLKLPLINRACQEELRVLFETIQDELKKSIDLYSQAETLLLQELGLKDFKPQYYLSYTTTFSNAFDAHRIDAEHFQPIYDEILKILKTKCIQPLSYNFKIIKGKNFEYTSDPEVGVIKTKQVGRYYINFETESYTTLEVAKNKRLPLLRNKDVLFASMGVGSLGKASIFYEFEIMDNKKLYTIDSTLKIFRSCQKSNLLPEVLVVYLNLAPIQMLIYKYIVGTSGIISIHEKNLNSFPTVILPKPIQQKISSLVQQSHQARHKAKQLLEEAKRKVEKEIERSSNSF